MDSAGVGRPGDLTGDATSWFSTEFHTCRTVISSTAAVWAASEVALPEDRVAISVEAIMLSSQIVRLVLVGSVEILMAVQAAFTRSSVAADSEEFHVLVVVAAGSAAAFTGAVFMAVAFTVVAVIIASLRVSSLLFQG